MDTSVLLERAQLLLEQARYKDAETYIRRALEQDPDNDYILSLLGRCYINSRRYDEGIEVVQQAIAVDPNNSFCFYLLGFAHYQKNNLPASKTNLQKAIQLNPYAAEYFGLLAHVLTEDKKFEAALDKANEGLALDADNITCLNARSVALNKLKRTEDAFETMSTALAQDPDNEVTHNVVGWNLLERGQHREATSHFMEALRLHPDYGNAKVGLKEALKSRIILYKWLLQYSFWINNQGRNMRVALPIIFYVVFRVLVGLSRNNGSETNLTWVLVAFYTFFVVISWTIGPIANLVLLFHPLGKHALTVKEKWSALTAVPAMLLGIVVMLLSQFTDMAKGSGFNDGLFFAGMICLSLALPLGQIGYPIRLRKENRKEWFPIGLVGFGLLTLFVFAVAPSVAGGLFICYGVAFLIYNWSGVFR